MRDKLISWFYAKTKLGQQLKDIRVKQKVLNCQLDYLMMNSNRKMRRKWSRMLNNPKSPFYIGDGSKPRIFGNTKYVI